MANKLIPKFGELTIRTQTQSSLDENDNDEMPNGFSTIDLNGTHSNYDINNSNVNSNSFQNNSNESDLGYTSFGIALNNQNQNNHSYMNNDRLPNNSTTLNGDSSQFSAPNSPEKILNNVQNSNNNNHNINSNNSSGLASILPTSISTSSATSMLSSASEASSKFAMKTASTIETLRQWGKSAYKCTRQIVSEKLGKCSRTVDPELEASIDSLRDVKKKYENVLSLANSLTSHFQNVINTQKLLGETFSDLAQKSSDLIDEFTTNSETQRQLVRQGELLMNGLTCFTSSLKTLCTKTMEDTLLTIRNYEAARLEYDAYRFDLENLKSAPSNEQKLHEIANLEQDVVTFREKYELLKKDVVIKMKFLDENRIKVMKKQLMLFQNAINSYFIGNYQALETSMKQLSLKQNSTSNNKLSANPDDGSYKFQSFLEQN